MIVGEVSWYTVRHLSFLSNSSIVSVVACEAWPRKKGPRGRYFRTVRWSSSNSLPLRYVMPNASRALVTRRGRRTEAARGGRRAGSRWAALSDTPLMRAVSTMALWDCLPARRSTFCSDFTLVEVGDFTSHAAPSMSMSAIFTSLCEYEFLTAKLVGVSLDEGLVQ